MINNTRALDEKSISFEKHFTIEREQEIVIEALAIYCPKISKRKLKLAMKYGCVWLTSKNRKILRIRKVKKNLSIGDKVSIYYDEAVLFSDIKPAKLIADEGDYSVWNKPCGMFSQGTKWGDHTSIARWVEVFGLSQNQIPERSTFLVHRLDRATNGLIVVAHSKKTTTLLTQLFEQRKIVKHYQAIVEGVYPIEKFKLLDAEIDDKKASSIVLSSDYDKDTNQSTLLIKIETGRKHQIRKHLSGVGFPIIGDRLYGASLAQKVDRECSNLMLKSRYLSFDCPMIQIRREYNI